MVDVPQSPMPIAPAAPPQMAPQKSNTLLFSIIIIVCILGFIVAGYFFMRNWVSTGSGNNMAAKIIFAKENATNAGGMIQSEVWMMNPDGSQATKVAIPQPNPIPLQNVSNAWVFYTIDRSSDYS